MAAAALGVSRAEEHNFAFVCVSVLFLGPMFSQKTSAEDAEGDRCSSRENTDPVRRGDAARHGAGHVGHTLRKDG
jgi:hypothetical protein